MANRFLALAAGAPGASTDCTALGGKRTVVVGGTLTGPVLLEISQDNANWVPLHTFGAAGSKEFEVAAAWMRINGGGVGVNADVGGEDTLTTTVTALAVPAGNGSGAGSDVSLLGEVKTIVVTGAFTGAVIIEQSLDGGTTWDPVKTFSRAGQWTSKFAAQQLRVTRNNAGGAAPVVSVGGADIDAADRQEVIAAVIAQTTAQLDTTLQVDSSAGGFPVDLPAIAAQNEGARITIKQVADTTNPVTVTPAGGDTIDGAATYLMEHPFEWLILESDGAGNWNVVAGVRADQTVSAVLIAQATAALYEVTRCDPTAGGFIVDLPAIAAGNAGAWLTVKNQSASVNNITITPAGGDTIDGAGTLVLAAAWRSVTLVSDGAGDWMVTADTA